MTDINYKFNEDELLKDLKEYVDATYGEHYAREKFQAAEIIIDCNHGIGFTIGNVMKYAQRYGKKAGCNRKDLMKILHYALMALYVHDLDHPKETLSEAVNRINNANRTSLSS